MTEKDDERKTQGPGTQEAENWETNEISVLLLQHKEDTSLSLQHKEDTSLSLKHEGDTACPLQHKGDTACSYNTKRTQPVQSLRAGWGIWEVGPTWVTDGHRPSLSSIPTATTWTLLSQSSPREKDAPNLRCEQEELSVVSHPANS